MLLYLALVPASILILFVVIIVDWGGAGPWIAASAGRTRKVALWTSLAANIAILALFKYWGFYHEVSLDFAKLLGFNQSPLPYLSLSLPIELSFHSLDLEDARDQCESTLFAGKAGSLDSPE